jgi:hypothetical protein
MKREGAEAGGQPADSPTVRWIELSVAALTQHQRSAAGAVLRSCSPNAPG